MKNFKTVISYRYATHMPTESNWEKLQQKVFLANAFPQGVRKLMSRWAQGLDSGLIKYVTAVFMSKTAAFYLNSSL